jgi:threonylcarbamoyladenosine tRNA methylthiotransferase MtaB
LTYFHVFPYSGRRGTAAVCLSDHVPGDKKKKRAKIMRALGLRKKREFAFQFIGRRAQILVEENVDGRPDRQRGFSRNYLGVMVRSAERLRNTEIEVELDGWEDGFLTGARVTGAERNAPQPD